MPTNTEKIILNALLDKFERRKAGSTRRVMLRPDQYVEYGLDYLVDREAFHEAVRVLSEGGYIELEWKPYKAGKSLNCVVLSKDRISEAYGYLGRLPKRTKNEEYLRELKDILDTFESEWIRDFIEDCITKLETEGKLSGLLSGDRKIRQDFYKLLKAVEDGVETSSRYLSMNLYGDSMTIERYHLSKLVSVARKHLDLDLDKKRVLDFLGIQNHPTEILVKGNFSYALGEGNVIDTSIHTYGTSINAHAIQVMEPLSINCTRILTIENKAPYYEYMKNAKEGELVIYLGGYYGKATRDFLKKIRPVIDPDTPLYHWGDVDPGGLRFFIKLCEILDRQVLPLKMDRDTYLDLLQQGTGSVGGPAEESERAEGKPMVRSHRGIHRRVVGNQIQAGAGTDTTLTLAGCLRKHRVLSGRIHEDNASRAHRS